MTVAEALREAAVSLEATSDTPRLDAEVLMAHALGLSRSELLVRHTDNAVPVDFTALLQRRLAQEPVAYITGVQEFYGLDLEVSPAVLIPRGDSEVLIEAARAAFANRPPKAILDLGTGSGALLLAAMTIWPEAEGLGIDSSVEALLVAMRNAQRHSNTIQAFVGSGPFEPKAHRPDRGFARLICRDWTARGWSSDLGPFDLILANPPYVEEGADIAASVKDYEPAGALFAGPEGLDDYRILVPQLPALLKPGGVALVEIGATQADAVTEIATRAGFSVKLHRDLEERPRALQLRIR